MTSSPSQFDGLATREELIPLVATKLKERILEVLSDVCESREIRILSAESTNAEGESTRKLVCAFPISDSDHRDNPFSLYGARKLWIKSAVELLKLAHQAKTCSQVGQMAFAKTQMSVEEQAESLQRLRDAAFYQSFQGSDLNFDHERSELQEARSQFDKQCKTKAAIDSTIKFIDSVVQASQNERQALNAFSESGDLEAFSKEIKQMFSARQAQSSDQRPSDGSHTTRSVGYYPSLYSHTIPHTRLPRTLAEAPSSAIVRVVSATGQVHGPSTTNPTIAQVTHPQDSAIGYWASPAAHKISGPYLYTADKCRPPSPARQMHPHSFSHPNSSPIGYWPSAAGYHSHLGSQLTGVDQSKAGQLSERAEDFLTPDTIGGTARNAPEPPRQEQFLPHSNTPEHSTARTQDGQAQNSTNVDIMGGGTRNPLPSLGYYGKSASKRVFSWFSSSSTPRPSQDSQGMFVAMRR
nr:uncharacterized protein CI109_001702 [Kwoniella shandongensis]KAA5529763.1 hypothetical protein CI109_001702 [Kwoniella shandongensis]